MLNKTFLGLVLASFSTDLLALAKSKPIRIVTYTDMYDNRYRYAVGRFLYRPARQAQSEQPSHTVVRSLVRNIFSLVLKYAVDQQKALAIAFTHDKKIAN